MTHPPPNSVLLETLRRDRSNKRNLLFTDPIEIIVCTSPSKISSCFRQMEQRRREGFYLAGFFSYELGYCLEESLQKRRPPSEFPLFWFGVYKKPLSAPKPRQSTGVFFLTEPKLAQGPQHYQKAITRIKEYIAAGDTYQINYTTRFSFELFGNVPAFYAALKKHQRVSYSALMSCGSNILMSLSPELFFRTDTHGNITVKPMKGTAPLNTPADWLQNDAKNTSENVMIVDLLRNDLGRICTPGSVRVRKLFAVEKYETLLQMTSTVSGKLQTGIQISDIIQSLFPCGSVTGAPKIQSMKIIRALENTPRDIYTGAIGYFAPNGESVFNVAIRTLDLRRESAGKYRGILGVGGGIVHDSKPEAEYDEARLKAKFLLDARPDFGLIETMLLVKGKISSLARHLKRLNNAAAYFGIPCNMASIKERLVSYAAGRPDEKLRLLLTAGGEICIESAPRPARPKAPRISLSSVPTDSRDPFLYFKSTHRTLYNTEHKRCAKSGFFDIIFKNEKDQITEGAISNIFIRKKNVWFTPPVTCGLLAGVQRETTMKKRKAREKILYEKDLSTADEILLTNAVRGETEVVFET